MTRLISVLVALTVATCMVSAVPTHTPSASTPSVDSGNVNFSSVTTTIPQTSVVPKHVYQPIADNAAAQVETDLPAELGPAAMTASPISPLGYASDSLSSSKLLSSSVSPSASSFSSSTSTESTGATSTESTGATSQDVTPSNVNVGSTINIQPESNFSPQLNYRPYVNILDPQINYLPASSLNPFDGSGSYGSHYGSSISGSTSAAPSSPSSSSPSFSASSSSSPSSSSSSKSSGGSYALYRRQAGGPDGPGSGIVATPTTGVETDTLIQPMVNIIPFAFNPVPVPNPVPYNVPVPVGTPTPWIGTPIPLTAGTPVPLSSSLLQVTGFPDRFARNRFDNDDDCDDDFEDDFGEDSDCDLDD